jgi:peptidoglycan hydrolase-like protein with peptidoglycan-binding domain
MNVAKPAGVILVAAIVVACAQTPKPTPQEPVAATQPLVVPKQEPVVVTDERNIAAAQPLAVPKREPGAVTDERDIAAAQRTLNQLGYNAGKIDGIVGPNVRQAIRAFQKDRGLVEDGRLTLALADKLKGETFIVVRPGDLLVYSDGETKLVAVEREVQWNQRDPHSLVAIRPSMAGWPTAARAGLDWAVSHALDNPASPVKWSSTGVGQNFEIYASELTPGEAALAGGDAQPCRRFEMRSDERQSRYPAIACRDGNGWYIPHSAIRLARPATGLGSAAPSNVR